MSAICPKHKTPLKVDLVQTGGCCGHSGEGDYCYCESPDMHVELFCDWKPTRGLGGCSHRVRVVEGLTDREGIERWIQARLGYTPEENV